MEINDLLELFEIETIKYLHIEYVDAHGNNKTISIEHSREQGDC